MDSGKAVDHRINDQIDKYITIIKIFKCQLCKFQNPSQEETRKHLKSHILKCTYCSESYILQTDLSEHIAQCRPHLGANDASYSNELKKENITSSSEPSSDEGTSHNMIKDETGIDCVCAQNDVQKDSSSEEADVGKDQTSSTSVSDNSTRRANVGRDHSSSPSVSDNSTRSANIGRDHSSSPSVSDNSTRRADICRDHTSSTSVSVNSTRRSYIGKDHSCHTSVSDNSTRRSDIGKDHSSSTSVSDKLTRIDEPVSRILNVPSRIWKKKPKRVQKLLSLNQNEKNPVSDTDNTVPEIKPLVLVTTNPKDVKLEKTIAGPIKDEQLVVSKQVTAVSARPILPAQSVAITGGPIFPTQSVATFGRPIMPTQSVPYNTSITMAGNNNMTFLMPAPMLGNPVVSQASTGPNRTVAVALPAGSVIIQPTVGGIIPLNGPGGGNGVSRVNSSDLQQNAPFPVMGVEGPRRLLQIQGKMAIPRQPSNQPMSQTLHDTVPEIPLITDERSDDDITSQMTPEEAVNYYTIKEAKEKAAKMTEEIRSLTAVQCHLCVRKFSNARAKATHINKFHCEIVSKQKSTGGPYYCNVASCSYKTIFKHYLENHLKKHESIHICNLCNKKFLTEHLLAKHQKSDRHHIKKEQLLCHTCGYSTSRKDIFKEHLASHMTKKPVKCDQCDYRTSSKQLLTRHTWRVHNKMPDRSHKCTECNYSCHTERELKIHHAKHTGEIKFRCPECKFGTNYRQNFMKHLKRHNMEMFQMDDNYVVTSVLVDN